MTDPEFQHLLKDDYLAIIAVANQVDANGNIFTEDALRAVADQPGRNDLFYYHGKLYLWNIKEKIMDRDRYFLVKVNADNTAQLSELNDAGYQYLDEGGGRDDIWGPLSDPAPLLTVLDALTEEVTK
jgi:hypothetical protein